MIKHFISRIKTNKRGQSFAELMLVVLILMLFLAGVVEFGFLMNNYLHIFDAAREAARFSSTSVAIAPNGSSVQQFYVNTAIQAIRVMLPVVPNGNRGDDVVISVFSVSGNSITRHPDGDGWSLCSQYYDAELNAAMTSYLSLDDRMAFINGWDSCTPRPSVFTDADILARMDPVAPASGVLLVEIFYNNLQILELPVFSQIIPNPILVYVYSVMPLSSAEPTPTPRP